MPRTNGPRFPGFPRPTQGYQRFECMHDCAPRIHDLPASIQPGVLLQVARKVYAAHFNDPQQIAALALYQAGDWLAIIRHVRRNDPAIAAELGVTNDEYECAVKIGRREGIDGDATKQLAVHDAFRNELIATVERTPPGPQQLRAVHAALADNSRPNALWVRRFMRNGLDHGKAEFLANLQEKLALELHEPQRSAFIRDCAHRHTREMNLRRMVLLFCERFHQQPQATPAAPPHCS